LRVIPLIVKAELATFDGFWQCRTLDTGALVHSSYDIGAPSAENIDFVGIKTYLSVGS